MVSAAVPLTSPQPNLTRRASLNAAQGLLDYTARLAVGLIVTPILLRGLGQSLFGIWQMLGQLLGYISAADGRPTDALRLVIANRLSVDDEGTMRRHVGSAMVVWLLFLPIVIVAGGALIWWAPVLSKVSPALAPTVRFAAALLVLQFLLATLAAVPESVLRGVNLGYRRMGLQSALQVLGGVFSVAAVGLGLGLVGLSIAQVALAILTAACFWLLARRYVPWFGIARPQGVEVRGMVRTSAWLAIGDLVAKLLTASDLVILGAVLTPAAATPYVLTGYASRTGMGIVALATLGAMPGLGAVIGQGATREQHAATLRRELLWLTWLATAALGVVMLLWNRSFVALWVGAEQYAGLVPNLLLVLVMVQTAFIRCDSYIIDAALQPRLRVLVGSAAAVVTIGACVVLTQAFGLVGLCIGIVAGRLVQSIAYPIIAARSIAFEQRAPSFWSLARPIGATIALFALAAFLGERTTAGGWAPWGLGVMLTAAVAVPAAYALGLSPDARRTITQRVRAVLRAARA